MRAIAVVGLLAGTGVPTVLNCRIEYENSAVAIATNKPPIGRLRTRGKKGSGQATVSTAPERSEARTTSGGRMTPALATLAVMASRGCWLAELRSRLAGFMVICALTRCPSRWILDVEVHFKSRGVMSDPPRLIAIGELARRTGLAGSALRYYERAGLLSPTARAGGRRHYGSSSAERVALIRLCQDAGFTLREIRALLTAWSRRSRVWAPLAQAKLRELDMRIAQAERAKALVQHALACPHRNLVTCPNFRATLKSYLESRARPGHMAGENAVPRIMQRRRNSARGVTGT